MLSIFQQLWPNLVSEALGILVTVLVINTLLQRREQKRWAPARLIIARQLARDVRDSFLSLFPNRRGHHPAE